jgi:hypothetical protein
MTEMHADRTSTYPGHETRDFSMRVVVLFGACLAVLLAGSLALMAWLFDVFNVTPAGQGLRGAPVAATPPRPPGPRLQPSPTKDMLEMLQAENARLQSYGWVDRSAGIARMPIDRAMEFVVQQGLPSWHEIPVLPPDQGGTGQEKSQ